MAERAPRILFLPIAIGVVLSVCPRVGGGAPAAIRVACVGDSITEASGWPSALQARLGVRYVVENYGKTGSTVLTKGDHPYVATTQYTDSHVAKPAIVVILLGTNDSKPGNWIHKSAFVHDYNALIESYLSLDSHPSIYLVLCPPAGTNIGQISGTVIADEVNPRIRQIAGAKHVQLVDAFAAFGGRKFDPTLFGPSDQVHPSAKGAQRIAGAVYTTWSAEHSRASALFLGASSLLQGI